MAAITTSTVDVLWQSGQGAEKAVLFKVPNFTTADTLDVASWFKSVKAATLIAGGARGLGTVSASGTTLTLTLAAAAADSIYLLVVGAN